MPAGVVFSTAFAISPAQALRTGPLQMDVAGASAFALFFIIVVVIIIVGAARSLSSRGRIQRPLSEGTAFPPPPPPDTIMVKCAYCGTAQTWRETCVRCGAPLPKPQIP